MPRDSQGVYSLPAGTIVNEGDTILPSQHNPAMEDLGQAISGSLSRDGLGAMRAPLSMGGFKATNLAPGTASTDAATFGQLTLGGSPLGVVDDFAGDTPPAGWLLCFGQAISRTEFAGLFAVIGTRFGAGDGTTTFNIPDCRGRSTLGRDDMGGTDAGRVTAAGSGIDGRTLGSAGGVQAVALSVDQLAPHSHGVNDPGHTHNYTNVTGFGGIGTGAGFGQASADTGPSATGISIQSTGSGNFHLNMQPSIVFNKIIRARSL